MQSLIFMDSPSVVSSEQGAGVHLLTKYSRLGACSRVIAAKPSHRAYAAKGKDFAGPVRLHRENGTFSKI